MSNKYEYNLKYVMSFDTTEKVLKNEVPKTDGTLQGYECLNPE